MNIKRFLVILAVFVLAAGLVSCTYNFEQQPAATPTTSDVGGPTPTMDVLAELGLRATQTAQALQQQNGAQTPTVPLEETPVVTEPPVEDTPEPTAAIQPTQAVVMITPTPGRPASHVLQAGEFPFCIARRFNVNQYDLLSVNGLTLNSRPLAGTRLTIPTTGNLFAGDRTLSPHPTTYTVRSGDTIYSIACKFGDVSPDMIAAANNLTAPYALSAGQTLQIP